MTAPLTLTFRRTERVPHLEAQIRRRFAALQRLCPEIQSGHVTIARTDGHAQTHRPYRVGLTLRLPGDAIEIRHKTPAAAAASATAQWRPESPTADRADAALAVKATFDAARRALQDVVRRKRRDVKAHTRARGQR